MITQPSLNGLSPETPNNFDVIIIGSGTAGSNAAIRLAQLFNSTAAFWRKILVIDERMTNAEMFNVGDPCLDKQSIYSHHWVYLKR